MGNEDNLPGVDASSIMAAKVEDNLLTNLKRATDSLDSVVTQLFVPQSSQVPILKSFENRQDQSFPISVYRRDLGSLTGALISQLEDSGFFKNASPGIDLDDTVYHPPQAFPHCHYVEGMGAELPAEVDGSEYSSGTGLVHFGFPNTRQGLPFQQALTRVVREPEDSTDTYTINYTGFDKDKYWYSNAHAYEPTSTLVDGIAMHVCPVLDLATGYCEGGGTPIVVNTSGIDRTLLNDEYSPTINYSVLEGRNEGVYTLKFFLVHSPVHGLFTSAHQVGEGWYHRFHYRPAIARTATQPLAATSYENEGLQCFDCALEVIESDLRDNYLIHSDLGVDVINRYYALSPTLETLWETGNLTTQGLLEFARLASRLVKVASVSDGFKYLPRKSVISKAEAKMVLDFVQRATTNSPNQFLELIGRMVRLAMKNGDNDPTFLGFAQLSRLRESPREGFVAVFGTEHSLAGAAPEFWESINEVLDDLGSLAVRNPALAIRTLDLIEAPIFSITDFKQVLADWRAVARDERVADKLVLAEQTL